METKSTKPKFGVYESYYGNAVVYKGGKTSLDLDMRERIPTSEIDFTKWIRELDKYE